MNIVSNLVISAGDELVSRSGRIKFLGIVNRELVFEGKKIDRASDWRDARGSAIVVGVFVVFFIFIVHVFVGMFDGACVVLRLLGRG